MDDVKCYTRTAEKGKIYVTCEDKKTGEQLRKPKKKTKRKTIKIKNQSTPSQDEEAELLSLLKQDYDRNMQIFSDDRSRRMISDTTGESIDKFIPKPPVLAQQNRTINYEEDMPLGELGKKSLARKKKDELKERIKRRLKKK